MAVTLTVIRAGANSRVVDVEATADADTTATIPHGLGVTPESAILEPLVAAARISSWIVTSKDATNVVLTKTTTMSSGAAGAQLRVTILKPHSITK